MKKIAPGMSAFEERHFIVFAARIPAFCPFFCRESAKSQAAAANRRKSRGTGFDVIADFCFAIGPRYV
ncbi:MAG: hypothetical protein CTY22_03870 [Methylomonas sp.]|nr:MAG: hypothetical protein CTY23_02135 [Methylomonas sp.]PPD26879.1 MAG: hypothetical protein CTY22_03870 [Methylomonas sp.]PPD37666.1 MAG: hypothetical protein CTY17_10640 [Methylomonas sp.]PPD38787.1 MAG: hypothetical protein CTY21_03870 [Methylomonas sp.]PPD53577.1 MAG: hypothetical protein CTY11_05800 [Methylomonas sp.]